jgi:hypothetical protein
MPGCNGREIAINFVGIVRTMLGVLLRVAGKMVFKAKSFVLV